MKGASEKPAVSSLILASGSPRRREIIGAAEARVALRPAFGEEPRPASGEHPEDYALRAALAKLGDGGQDQEQDRAPSIGGDVVIVSADTVVALDGEIFGKPRDEAEAREMLRRLRNRWHIVITAVAVRAEDGRTAADCETSRVLTRDYADDEMERSIALGAPFDKAGGYAVQDARFAPVVRVDGCYLNAVGLPLCLLRTLIGRLGLRLRLRPPARIPYYEKCADCKLAPVREDGE